MQRAKQGKNQDKPDRSSAGGLPVAQDATQRNEARRTPESRGDRDDHIGSHNQGQARQAGRGAR